MCLNTPGFRLDLFVQAGTFTPAKKQLYDKAVKAVYSLKRNILSLNPNIYTSLHIFDHTVKPILLYESEIWLCSLSKKATMQDLFDYSKISKSFNSEKLHIHFCKYILGVHKKSSNFAITSELARYRIQVNILLQPCLIGIDLKLPLLSFLWMHLHAQRLYTMKVPILGLVLLVMYVSLSMSLLQLKCYQI